MALVVIVFGRGIMVLGFVVVGSVVEGCIIFVSVVVGCGTLAVNIVDEVVIECVYVVVLISS